MGSTMEGTAGAGAGVLTGIGAMRSGLIAVIAGSMMTGTGTGTIIGRVIARDARAQVPEGGGDGAAVEALGEGGTVVRSGIAVRRDVPELSSGTGRGRSKNLQGRLMLRKPIMVTEDTCKMLAHIMGISSKSSNSNLLRRDIDLFLLLWFVFTLFCFRIPMVVGNNFYSSIHHPQNKY